MTIPNILQQIEFAKASFRHDWSSGGCPSISNYLKRIAPEGRELLFQGLLLIDMRFRQGRGEFPVSDDYLAQFPEFKNVIGDVFFQSISIAGDLSEPVDLVVGEITPGVSRLGDYELLGELGRGGFGVVYMAKHRTCGDRVALKTIPPTFDVQSGTGLHADRLRQFRKEFRSLSEINHPNLVGMQTLGVVGNQWFFTMDLIEGVDFVSYVRPEGELDLNRLGHALQQLISGIAALHEKGILHRDLKPRNVLVDSHGHLTILDFGLVAELEERTDHTASLPTQSYSGTPRYSAPEQVFGQRTPASDWYSLGTMLYEALTGEPPFQGTNAQLLVRKQSEKAPALSNREELPSDLCRLVDGLLKRSAAKRPDLKEIVETLQIDLKINFNRDQDSQTGPNQDSQFLDESNLLQDTVEYQDSRNGLFGRDAHLAALNQIHDQWIKSRSSKVAFINGQSGEGKSALAEAHLEPLRAERRAVVFSGRCYERESVPYKAVDCWIDSLVTFLRGKSEDWLVNNLPQDVSRLAQVFPMLNRVEAILELPDDDEMIESKLLFSKAFAALRELIRNISRETPVVVFVDDLQWADAESVTALEVLLSSPNAPTVMFLGCFRCDERESSPFLMRWRELDSALTPDFITLTPLNKNDSLRLINNLITEPLGIDENGMDRVFQESEGNPYLLFQMVEDFDSESGEFRPVFREMIAERLKRLPPLANSLLELLAVVGQDLSMKEIDLYFGESESPYSTLMRMRNENLVRLIGSQDLQRVSIYHSRIRESVLEQMSEERRRDWRLRIAVVNKDKNANSESANSDSNEQGDTADDLDHPGDEPKPSPLDNPGQVNSEYVSQNGATRLMADPDEIPRLHSELTSIVDSLIADQKSHATWNKLREKDSLPHLEIIQKGLQKFAEAVSNIDHSKGLSDFASIQNCIHATLDLMIKFIPRNSDSDPVSISLPPSISARKISIPNSQVSKLLDSAFNQVQAASEARQLAATSQMEPFISTNPDISSSAFRERRIGIPQRIICRIRRSQPSVLKTRIRLAKTFASMGNERITPAVFGEFDSAWADAARLQDWISAALALYFVRDSLLDLSIAKWLNKNSPITLSKGAKIDDRKRVLSGVCRLATQMAQRGQLFRAATQIQQAIQSIDTHNMPNDSMIGCTQGFFLMQCSQVQSAKLTLESTLELIRQKRQFSVFNLRCVPLLLECLVGFQWLEMSEKLNKPQARFLVHWSSCLGRRNPKLRAMILRTFGRLAASRGKTENAIRLFENSVKHARRRRSTFCEAKALLDWAAVDTSDQKPKQIRAIELLKQKSFVIPRAESWLLGDFYNEYVIAPDFDAESWEADTGIVSQTIKSQILKTKS